MHKIHELVCLALQHFSSSWPKLSSEAPSQFKASAKGARSVPDSLQQELRSRPRKLLLLVFAAVNLVAPVLRLNLRPRILGAHNWRLRTVRQGKMKTLSLVLLLDVAADDQR